MSKTDILDIFAKRNVLPIRQIQDEAKVGGSSTGLQFVWFEFICFAVKNSNRSIKVKTTVQHYNVLFSRKSMFPKK